MGQSVRLELDNRRPRRLRSGRREPSSRNSSVAIEVDVGARRNYSVVSLVGDIESSTPVAAPDAAHFLNSFFTNPDALRCGVSWPAGATNEKFDSVLLAFAMPFSIARRRHRRRTPIPILATWAPRSPVRCRPASARCDGTTYHSADGSFLTVDGVQKEVAAAARPTSATLSAPQQFLSTSRWLRRRLASRRRTPIDAGGTSSNARDFL